ncbi:MAG TPA: non-ribosomal peptide synthetase, partial [Afifellaceae bacterium]|nr:non-ribosomal peptide synthetase [Afifellaceae bacterium]
MDDLHTDTVPVGETPAADPRFAGPATKVYDDIFRIVDEQARLRPDALAIEDKADAAITYAKLLSKVCGLVKAFRACGIARTSRVAIVLPNGAELAVALLGVTSTAASVPFNPAYRREEYESYFSEIGVDYLLTRRNFETEARTVARERNIPVIELSDDSAMQLEIDGMPLDSDPQDMPSGWREDLTGADDVALILLTSGSTGRSKKVPLTHRNICVSVADICRTLELTPDDKCLCMWEQFHVGGLVDLLLVPLASGGSVVCAGGFDAPLYYDLLERKQPTWFQGVPTTLYELSRLAKRSSVDPHAAPLRFIRSVASSLSPQLMQEIEDLFDVPVVQTFGMTEAGPLITTNRLPPGRRKPGSVGYSCGPDIRIVSPDGRDLPVGEIGEIVIRGPNVISGYEDAPEANAHSFRDGWFRTGDTGYLDEDDFLYLTGRLKEMINRGGEKITPQEIDDVLLTHPAIAQAASFSVQHRTLGEDVAAAIVLRTPDAIDENEIRAFVGSKLADFKVPQKVMILQAMPRDPIGKINRLSLSTLADAEVRAKPAEAASGETEKRIGQIWAEELGLDDVGAGDNFFALGGDSLSGVRVVLTLEEAFDVQLPANMLVNHATVRQMAALIDSGTLPPRGDGSS